MPTPPVPHLRAALLLNHPLQPWVPRRNFPEARIVVTQPRRLAAATLAKRVAHMLGVRREPPLSKESHVPPNVAPLTARRDMLSEPPARRRGCSQEPVGQSVGYAIRGERVGYRSRLIFCTTGWLLECAKKGNPFLQEATHIVLDEASA